MIARGFKSVLWVGAVGGAALSCYMVSLRVATERNEMLKVERQILMAKQDIRALQTELGTRGRMTQLEQWNTEVLALAAPSSTQFLKDEFTLARLERHEPTVAERSAEVQMAAMETAPAVAARPAGPAVVAAVAPRPAPGRPVVHQASFATGAASKPAAQPEAVKPRTQLADARPAKPSAAPQGPAVKPAKAAAAATPSDKPAKPKPAAVAAAKPAKPATIAAARPARNATPAARLAQDAATPAGARTKRGGAR